MKKETQLAVQAIAARIIELCGRVQLQSHVQNFVSAHYLGGLAEQTDRKVLDALGQAEELFCDDPLKLTDQAVIGSLTKHQSSDTIAYALGCILTLVSRTLDDLQGARTSAGQLTLAQLLSDGSTPAPSAAISLEDAKKMPQIGEIFVAVCLRVREKNRSKELARKLAETSRENEHHRQEFERQLQESRQSASNYQRQITELSQQLQPFEQTKSQLETANGTCARLSYQLAQVRRAFKGSLIMLVIAVIAGLLAFGAMMRFTFERTEAGNYIGFAAAGMVLASIITLLLLPERTK